MNRYDSRWLSYQNTLLVSARPATDALQTAKLLSEHHCKSPSRSRKRGLAKSLLADVNARSLDMDTVFQAALNVQQQQDTTLMSFPTIDWTSDDEEEPQSHESLRRMSSTCQESLSDEGSETETTASEDSSCSLQTKKRKCFEAPASRMVRSREFHSKLWMLAATSSPKLHHHHHAPAPITLTSCSDHQSLFTAQLV